MVRRKQTTHRKRRSRRFLYPILTEASDTSPPTTDADIMNFIQKKATQQRQSQPWWEKLASPTKQQWAYANAYHRAEEYAKKRGALRSPPKKKQRRRAGRHPPMRKKKPPKQKTCMTLMELARAFPNIAQQVCFHPKQSTFNSLVGRVPRSKQKVDQWL